MNILMRLAFFVVSVTFSVGAIAQERNPKVDFVYVGDEYNCSYCRGWKMFDLPQLKKEPVFGKITYTEVWKSSSAGIPSASSMPPGLVSARDAIAESFGGSVGTPMFAVLVDGKVVWNWRGVPANEKVIEVLTAALRTREPL